MGLMWQSGKVAKWQECTAEPIPCSRQVLLQTVFTRWYTDNALEILAEERGIGEV